MTFVARPAWVTLAAALAVTVLALPPSPARADSIRDEEWHLRELKISQAQKITEGAGVTVALIDTGVNADHRDLAGAVLAGTDVSAGSKGNGRFDDDGHGSEMAGIIAARGHGSGDGVLGIAPAAKILPIKAPIQGFSSSSFMTSAVDYAIAHHAGVINMSFGSPDDTTLHDAIRKAAAADIVLIASSGNGPGDNLIYPGKYPEVLTVGAYGRDGKVASFSVRGSQVDISAPGVDIVTTGNQGSTDYYKGSGTSEATAIVSGAAALLRAKYPDDSAAEIVHRLTATATDAGAHGRDDSYGYGRLNILKALTVDVAPLPSTSRTSSPAPVATEAADLPSSDNSLLYIGLALVVVVLVGGVVVVMWRRAR